MFRFSSSATGAAAAPPAPPALASPSLTPLSPPAALGKGGLRALLQSRGALIALCVVTAALVVVFIVYLAIRVRRGNLQAVTLTSGIYNMASSGVPVVLDKSQPPATVNGQEFAYSFWIYLSGLQPTAEHKLLFTRTPNASSAAVDAVYTQSNPVVFLDKATNKLYIAVTTTNMTSSSTPSLDDLAATDAALTHLTSAVGYVPMSRWVHCAVCVQDSGVTTYIDGQLYSVMNIPDPPSGSTTTRPVFAATTGSVQLGESSTKVSGYLTQLQFLNYAPTARQVQGIYEQGPSGGSLWARLGLPPYKLQSPIVRADTT